MGKRDGYRTISGAFLALLVPLGITLWMWRSSSNETMQVARERFMFKVSEGQFAIRQRLLAYEQILRGGVALFNASDEVRRDEWRTYVATLNVDRNYPGIRGIGFAKYIRPDELEEHVRGIRTEIASGYTIRPAGQRPEYTSIIYLEPFDWRNQRAFGYDMFTEPVRRAAMERARDTGSPSVSRRVKLVQETETKVQQGFLMYLPVYRKGASLKRVEHRRAALSGYVYAPFRMNDLMQGILGEESSSATRLQIFDGEGASPDDLMYDSVEEQEAVRLPPSAFSATRPLEFNGRTWTLRFSSLPPFDATIDTERPGIILISGILVSILFATAVMFSSLNRQRARQLIRANADLKAEIEERTKLEADLKFAKNAAEAANQAKIEFLANVSHELRTPLTLILAPLEQLNAAAVPPADWHAHLQRMTRNAMLLLNRVNDILDFSKADAGKFDVVWQRTDLRALMAPMMEDAEVAARSKGRTLDWMVHASLDAVAVDPRHFEKILLNLVGNALKFTPEGGAVSVAVEPFGNDRYQLSVADTGIGIPAERLSELFTRFHQIDTSATRQYGGSGIGLALVKQLAELMGGEVGVRSEVGKGSVFFVRLPRTAADCVGAATASRREPGTDALRRLRFDESGTIGTAQPPSVSTAMTGRPRVLVADDNADMCDYVAGLLDDECMVAKAGDGAKAWELLRQQAFDLVVSDVMMPDLDGLGLTARIKSEPALAKVPVILVTARGGAEASAAGLACGADDYIAKPFSQDELKARVRAALRMAKMQAQLRDMSCEAGMAMVAAGVLHNIGNMLCNVSVATDTIHDILRRSDVRRLDQLAGVLRSADSAVASPSELPAFIEQLASRLRAEHQALLNEAASLRHCMDNAAGIIRAQKNFVGTGGELAELVSVPALLDSALALSQSQMNALGIAVERDYKADATVRADRYRLLQILHNLITNAIDALQAAPTGARRLTVGIDMHQGLVRIDICDSGAGVDSRDLPMIFNQGFSTKGDGRGYGLHLSNLWARESGGALRCYSDGPGRGASFVLELPCPSSNDAEASAPTTVAASSI